jgi:hypothetical protein
VQWGSLARLPLAPLVTQITLYGLRPLAMVKYSMAPAMMLGR